MSAPLPARPVNTTAKVPVLLFALLLGLGTARAGEWVTHGATEHFAAGDFNGDGRRDVVIVDRASGLYRIGYQNADGTLNWVPARASGVADVTGFSVGRVFATTRDGLAFTAPAANRVNLLDAATPATAGLPVSVFPPAVGPTTVLALDIPAGAGNTALEDLFLTSEWNNGNAGRVTWLRNTGTAPYNTLLNVGSLAPMTDGNAVRLKVGGPLLAGVISRSPNTVLRVYSVAATPITQTLSAGLVDDSRFLAGFFSGGTHAEFLTWVPGALQVQMRPVTEPVAGSFQFGATQTFPVAGGIREISLVRQSAELRLAVVFGEGATAGIYRYQAGALTLLQTLTAPAGERFNAALDLGADKLLFTTSPPGGGASTRFQQFNHDGSAWVAGAAGDLRPLGELAGRANVLLFQNEPFVNEFPNLLKTLQAGDWSSGLQLAGNPPSVTVQAATYGGATQGIGAGTATALGTAPAGTAFGLVNQHAPFLSIMSYSPAAGDAIGDAQIVPPGGFYQQAIAIHWTNVPAGHQLHYRKGAAGDWTLWGGGSFWLFTNDVVRFYTKPAVGDTKSVVRAANYQFSLPPDQMDSDGDGVPDYVEVAKGLDPLAGNDTDGDGYFDYEELMAGTDPNNPASHPAGEKGTELKSSFDLALTLRPMNGANATLTLAQTGQATRAHDLHGALLSATNTANNALAGVTDPSARLTQLPADLDLPLVVVATDPHFFIQTAAPDKKIGRELLGLYIRPDIGPALSAPYSFGHGNLVTEANNWIAAAQAALPQRPLGTGELEPLDTLVALLLELKVWELLLDRGLYAGEAITLFPFRAGDAGRLNPAPEELAALEFAEGGLPGVRLADALAIINHTAKTSTHAAVVALRKLTRDLYEMSSALNNTHPGTYAPPVAVLRQFFTSGALPPAYAAWITFPTGSGSHPLTGVNVVLDAVTTRPQVTLTLRVRPDSFGVDCTRLENLAGTQLHRLLALNGDPFNFAEFFTPLPGTLVEIKGYADAPPNPCAPAGIYVTSALLLAVPTVTLTDTDGDLLPDDLEWALFGSLDQTAFGDADGDGITNLQEILEGTDPKDKLSGGTVLFTGPPAIEIEELVGGQFQLTWHWPTVFASKLNFHVLAATTLGTGFTAIPLTPTILGPDTYQAILPAPDTGTKFYQIQMSLK
jgi:hypothetical protein